MQAKVTTVSKSETYTFHKYNCDEINLIKNHGVEGDIHACKKVKHRSRVQKNPNQPNLRQVHLIHSELHDELKTKGFDVKAGQIGENITTVGIDLLNLPKGTILKIGESAQIEVTGLRNPCNQLNLFQKGLLNALIDKDEHGNLIRKSGIMGIVLESGIVRKDDLIEVVLPSKPFVKLERV